MDPARRADTLRLNSWEVVSPSQRTEELRSVFLQESGDGIGVYFGSRVRENFNAIGSLHEA